MNQVRRHCVYTIASLEVDEQLSFSMSSPVATRHTSKAPSLTLSTGVAPSGESHPPAKTPPTATGDIDNPFQASPRTPRVDVARSKSQSRRTLGNWQLGKTIGQGSMGRVRLGHNLITGEQVSATWSRH